MNCTGCGKAHSKEQPLTIINDVTGELVCPNCLKVVENADFDIEAYIKEKLKDPVPESAYGKSPISGYSGTVKVNGVELPFTKIEFKYTEQGVQRYGG